MDLPGSALLFAVAAVSVTFVGFSALDSCWQLPARFKKPNLFGQLIKRMVFGNKVVVDQETVTRIFPRLPICFRPLPMRHDSRPIRSGPSKATVVGTRTLLRRPTGIWYSPGVKADMTFFDKKEGRAETWIDKLWVYDLRTNMHFTLKQSPVERKDFDEFVAWYKPGRMHERAPTWKIDNPEGRWHCYDYDELLKRDKLSFDLFWIKDKSLTDTVALPAPDILATEIADDLEPALERFTKIAARLGRHAGSVA